MSEIKAVNVVDEAENEFWNSLQTRDASEAAKNIPVLILKDIFDSMVIPAIDEARRLDRGGEVKKRDKEYISKGVAKIISSFKKNHRA